MARRFLLLLLLLILGPASLWLSRKRKSAAAMFFKEALPTLPPEITVIVPTYKEVDNIPHLARALFEVAEKGQLKLELLFVDDDSNDGSVQKVEELAKRYPVRILVRKRKRGLSSAVLTGFQNATTNLLVVMDADLSHPPEKLPALVGPLLRGESGFSLGSRYQDGASVAGWSLARRTISLGATWLAAPVLPHPVTDPMSGFFAIRRDVLAGCAKLNPVGFKIGLELLVKCSPPHVTEIPIPPFFPLLHPHR